LRFAYALFLSRNPTSKIALVGGFEVTGIVSGKPHSLCKKWLTQSGVEKAASIPAVVPVYRELGVREADGLML
jgi:hypothetical protein